MKNKLKFGILDYGAALGFLAYSSSAAVLAIAVVNMSSPQELDFSFSSGGMLQSLRMIAIFFILFLSGFLASGWGKCRSIALSSLLMSVGLLLGSLAPNFYVLLGAMILLGFGEGVLEGLLNPVVQESHPDDSGRYLNITNGFWSVGVLGTMIVGGFLLSNGISWRVLMVIASILCLLPATIFWRYRNRLPNECIERPLRTLLRMRNIVCDRKFYFFVAMMMLCGAGEGILTFWGAAFIETSFEANEQIAGIMAALFSAGMLLARLGCGVLVPQKHLRMMIFISAVLAAVISLWLPFVYGFTMLGVVMFLAGVSVACFWPSIQSYAAEELKMNATLIFILLSCAGIPGFSLGVLLVGIGGDLWGFRYSFLIIPIIFGILAALILFYRDSKTKLRLFF